MIHQDMKNVMFINTSLWVTVKNFLTRKGHHAKYYILSESICIKHIEYANPLR